MMAAEGIFESVSLSDLEPHSKALDITPVPLSAHQELLLGVLEKLAKVDVDTADAKSLLTALSELDKLVDTLPKLDLTKKRAKEHAVFGLVRTLQKVRDDAFPSERDFLYPPKDPIGWRSYLRQEAVRWSATEIDFTKDIPDFRRAPKWIKRALVYIFGMFGHLDNNVASNCLFRFLMEAETMEDSLYYALQLKVEGVHIESYHKNIVALLGDYPELLTWVKAAHKDVPSIRNMHRFADKYQHSDLPKEERLLAFMCVEGIFFIGAFEFFYWLGAQTSGKKPKYGFDASVFLNKVIGKEEGLHRDHAQDRENEGLETGRFSLSQDAVHTMLREAVEIAREFIYDCVPEAHDGYNPDDIFHDTRYLANIIAKGLGFASVFPDISTLRLEEFKTFAGNFLGNFYEVKISQYAAFDPDKAFRDTMILGAVTDPSVTVKEPDYYHGVSSEEDLGADFDE